MQEKTAVESISTGSTLDVGRLCDLAKSATGRHIGDVAVSVVLND